MPQQTGQGDLQRMGVISQRSEGDSLPFYRTKESVEINFCGSTEDLRETGGESYRTRYTKWGRRLSLQCSSVWGCGHPRET